LSLCSVKLKYIQVGILHLLLDLPLCAFVSIQHDMLATTDTPLYTFQFFFRIGDRRYSRS
jgi:hypothetical protein